jgi:hypothetical protein
MQCLVPQDPSNDRGSLHCWYESGHEGKHSWEHARSHDPVDHPKHYNSHPSGIECIVVARHHNFNIGNVFKYLWRAGLKAGAGEHPTNNASTVQDLEKARWYLTDEINRLKEQK